MQVIVQIGFEVWCKDIMDKGIVAVKQGSKKVVIIIDIWLGQNSTLVWHYLQLWQEKVADNQ